LNTVSSTPLPSKAAAPNPGRGILRRAWDACRHFRPVLIVTVLLFIVLAVTQSRFATSTNLQNLLTAISVLWIVSLGMTFVVMTAGADLSVGALAALAGIFFAKIVAAGIPGWPALALTCLFGFIVGAVINGFCVGKLGMSFFVVTLASMIGLTGVVNLWSNTQSFIVESQVPSVLGVNKYAGLPAPIWIMIASLLVMLYLQQFTYFGRHVYAVGGSLKAARLSGIRTPRTIMGVYAVSALCATIGSVITIGRIGVAAPTVDVNLPLQAIAAVLLGGTSLSGGTGGVGGTAIGVLFIGVLQNGLSIAGVQSFWQQVITGLILLLAVMIDQVGTPTWLRLPQRRTAAAEA
jgi:ribose/xylose/arabinose/galactoside ABC-type transport system permease subunit